METGNMNSSPFSGIYRFLKIEKQKAHKSGDYDLCAFHENAIFRKKFRKKRVFFDVFCVIYSRGGYYPPVRNPRCLRAHDMRPYKGTHFVAADEQKALLGESSRESG